MNIHRMELERGHSEPKLLVTANGILPSLTLPAPLIALLKRHLFRVWG